MSFKLLGVEIPEIIGKGTIKVLGQAVDELKLNGTTVWKAFDDTPTEIAPPTNFTASTTYTDYVQCTWTDSPDTTHHDLYRNGQLAVEDVDSGVIYNITGPNTSQYKVKAIKDDLSAFSNEATGIAKETVIPPSGPSKPSVFLVSTTKILQIEFIYSAGYGATRHDLYETNGTLVASNIASGYTKDYPNAYEADFYVKAVNYYGEANSDTAKGIALAPVAAGDVFVTREEISGSNPETVTGSGGTYTFTVPDRVTTLNVIMHGAGGSGSSNYITSSSATAGGGFAGLAYTQSVTVEPNSTITINLGKGGDSVSDGNNYGVRGGDTTISAISGIKAAGGAGGSYSTGPDGAYAGRGQGMDGDSHPSDWYGEALGGQGDSVYGFKGGFGWEYDPAGKGKAGCGGGGVTKSNGGGEPSGEGGSGWINFTWGG